MNNDILIKISGKISLAGEHAVVYGGDAISFPINRHCQINLTQQATSIQHILSAEFDSDIRLSWNDIEARAAEIKKRHQQFVNQSLPIEQVCQHNTDLIIACMDQAKQCCPASKDFGHRIEIQSNIPVGLGMGSSAAVIVAILSAFCRLYDTRIPNDRFEAVGRSIENLQHGNSSGMDIATCHRGCGLLFHDGISPINVNNPLPLHFINTGLPHESTGTCVSQAQQHWNNQQHLAAFNHCTTQLRQAIVAQDIQTAHQAIQDNHQLLCELRVVPKAVQDFVAHLEKNHCSAKICGAGGISAGAGIVMVLGEHWDPNWLAATNYRQQNIQLINTKDCIPA